MLEAVEKSYALLVGREKEAAATLEAVLQSDTELPYDPEIPYLSIYPRKRKTYVHTKLVHECA